MKKLSVVIFLVFALISWGCDDGKKTIGDEEGVILIEERALTEEEIEEECPNGGVKIVTGFDKNGNGVLDEDEILDNYFVCHGKDGEDGTSTLTEVIPIDMDDDDAPEHDCENGGYWIITCEDDGEGECVDETEVFEAVCHGTDGEDGVDGACADNTVPVIDEIWINKTEFAGEPILILDGVVTVEIVATDEDEDNLVYVVTGSGAMIEQDETDKHKFTLTFNSEGIYCFSVIVSDECQMAVKSFAVEVVCAGDFPNYHDGRCWSDPAPSTMNWGDAIDYCEDLGGRLPNIQELRSLIQNCPQTEYPQPNGQDPWCEIEDPDKLAFDDWTVFCDPRCSGDINVFGHTGAFWSSSVYVNSTYFAWYVSFSDGSVYFTNKPHTIIAICVR